MAPKAHRPSLDAVLVALPIGIALTLLAALPSLFAPHYLPEIGRWEQIDAMPDRAHNETLDALVSAGVIGATLELALSSAPRCLARSASMTVGCARVLRPLSSRISWRSSLASLR